MGTTVSKAPLGKRIQGFVKANPLVPSDTAVMARAIETVPFFGGKVVFRGVVRASIPQHLRAALGVVGLSIFVAACAANPEPPVPLPGSPAALQPDPTGSADWSDGELGSFVAEPHSTTTPQGPAEQCAA